MATKRPDPAPGPQNPAKYTSAGLPAPGPKYQKFGEQPGYLYDPYSDSYKEDPNVQKKYLQDQGLVPKDPKPTTLTSSLLPIGAGAATLYGAKGLVEGGKLFGYDLGSGAGAAVNEGVKTGLADVGTTATIPSIAPQAGGLIAPGATTVATDGSLMTAVPEGYHAASLAAGAPNAGLIGGEFGAANVIGGGAGLYGAYDLATHDRGPLGGAAEGAASGALIGTYVVPGIGTGVGAAVGGGLGLVKGLMEKPSTKEIQSGRFKAAGVADPYGKAGHDFFAGTGGETSRDERFLTPEAIAVNPDNYNAAADFDTWSPEMKTKFLSGMLSAGKVQEKKGGIYYDDAYAKTLADQIRAENTAAPIARTPSGQVAGTTVPPMQNNITMQQANNLQGRTPVAMGANGYPLMPVIAPPRSQTISPGIAKGGGLFSYRR